MYGVWSGYGLLVEEVESDLGGVVLVKDLVCEFGDTLVESDRNGALSENVVLAIFSALLCLVKLLVRVGLNNLIFFGNKI